MLNKEKIIELYYEQHLKVKDIEEYLKISSAYVSKIIKQDTRYDIEKNKRKELSAHNRKIANKRKEKN